LLGFDLVRGTVFPKERRLEIKIGHQLAPLEGEKVVALYADI